MKMDEMRGDLAALIGGKEQRKRKRKKTIRNVHKKK